MQPIYKVTSKKIAEMLEAELERRDKHTKAVLRKVKKIVTGVSDVSFDDSFVDGKRCFFALAFKKGKEIDTEKWKGYGYVNTKSGSVTTYMPKKTSTFNRDLYNRLRVVMKAEKFFQSDEILKEVKYMPEEGAKLVSNSRLQVNTFGVGYATVNGEKVFIFKGYDGYKPPRGIKELYISEYNKLMKK